MDVHPTKNGIYRYWPIPNWWFNFGMFFFCDWNREAPWQVLDRHQRYGRLQVDDMVFARHSTCKIWGSYGIKCKQTRNLGFFFLSKRRDMSKCGNDLGQFFSNALSHLSQKTKAPREHLKNSTSDGIFTMDFLWIFHTPFGEDSLRRP